MSAGVVREHKTRREKERKGGNGEAVRAERRVGHFVLCRCLEEVLLSNTRWQGRTHEKKRKNQYEHVILGAPTRKLVPFRLGAWLQNNIVEMRISRLRSSSLATKSMVGTEPERRCASAATLLTLQSRDSDRGGDSTRSRRVSYWTCDMLYISCKKSPVPHLLQLWTDMD